MSDFLSLRTTKLGTYAENIFIPEMENKYNYKALVQRKEGSHDIDCYMLSTANTITWAMDVKCKSSFDNWPITGIDAADYEKYKKFPYPVFLLFADINKRKVYGSWMKPLIADAGTRNYYGYDKTKTEMNCMYFELSAMTHQHIRNLTEEEYQTMKALENSRAKH